MARAMARSTVAKDFTEVDSKLNELMSVNEITSDEILQFDIKPFGASKFLITLLYWGTYALSTVLGLKNKILYGVGSIKKPLLGLVPTLRKGLSRPKNALLGLLPISKRGMGPWKVTLAGLAVILKASKQLWGGFPLCGLLSVAKKGFSKKAITPPVGFLSDVDYVLTHP